jgi:hypothetical protein
MAYRIKAQDIFHDIEFELIQGAIRQDEMGQSLQAVRKFHNDLRSELLVAVRDLDQGRQIVTRQTQFNDMVITLLQEMSGELLRMQRQQRQLNGWLEQNPSRNQALSSESTQADQQASDRVGIEVSQIDNFAAWGVPPRHPDEPTVTDQQLEAAMAAKALDIPLDVRPISIPVIGWFLYRIRAALHSLAFFYTRRLADRQTEINRLYAERLLSLSQTNAQLHSQIISLAAEVEQLRLQSKPPK